VPIAEVHTPNSDRTAATSLFSLAQGFLVGLQVRASAGAPRRGQVFVIVDLVRGRLGALQPLGVLLQGYVQDTTVLAWPGSPIIASPEGPGFTRLVTGTNPGAGIEIIETVPTNARWRLLSIAASLVTDATVTNRLPSLVLDDGASIYARIPAAAVQVASLTTLYTWAVGAVNNAVATSVSAAPAPQGVMLMGGHRIRTLTANIAGGDDWGAPVYVVEEWIED
jgi:hypothetical protein